MTIRLTPARQDLEIWNGDDVGIQLVFTVDAPNGSKFTGDWSSSRAYVPNDIAQFSGNFYVALFPSMNSQPDIAMTLWRALTLLDISGYSSWAAQIRLADDDASSFTVDSSQQGSSIITLTMAGDMVRARARKSVTQRWDVQALDASGLLRTLIAGSVLISQDATR